jgi:NADH:ubiquinone oxidoreductase subunit 3 (subunit A)
MRGASNKRNKKYAKERLVAIEAMAGKRERRKMEERREDCGEEVESLDLLLYTILYYSILLLFIPFHTIQVTTLHALQKTDVLSLLYSAAI